MTLKNNALNALTFFLLPPLISINIVFIKTDLLLSAKNVEAMAQHLVHTKKRKFDLMKNNALIAWNGSLKTLIFSKSINLLRMDSRHDANNAKTSLEKVIMPLKMSL